MKTSLSILLVEKDPDEQFIFRQAISAINDSINVELLHTTEQLPDYLLKGQLERDLNRQVLPDLVLVNLNSRFDFDIIIGRIRQQFSSIKLPIYLLSPRDLFSAIESKALACGFTEVFMRPSTFFDLSPLIRKIIFRRFPAVIR